ncbi:MAG: hypothetical protein RAO75_07320 [Candidatus Chlorobium antarcticum]|nr:hypothetical protein [Candidatus Chlorobium antarcticum]
MMNSTVPVKGVRAFRTGFREFRSRIFFSILSRIFPSLRNFALPAPPSLEMFATDRKLVFTNPLMARTILQHRRSAVCFAGRECDKPVDRLWDPFGHGFPSSLNGIFAAFLVGLAARF